MGCRLRRVPKNWEHPRDRSGDYKPLFDGYYPKILAIWMKEKALWEKGKHPDQIYFGKNETACSFNKWESKPQKKYYVVHNPARCKYFQLYETCTECTPITPVFKTIEEVAKYASEHCNFGDFVYDYEDWLGIIKTSYEEWCVNYDYKITTIAKNSP